MEHLIAALLIIGSAIIAIVLNLVANELYDCGPWFARWLIDCALARLPKSERERCREEWYADNESWPGGKLGKIRHAAGCWLGARAVGRVLIGPTPETGRHVEPNKDIENQIPSVYANAREGWLVAFEDEPKEVERIIALSRQDRDRRAEHYKHLRDKFFTCLEKISDDYNSDGDVIDALVQWLANRQRNDRD